MPVDEAPLDLYIAAYDDPAAADYDGTRVMHRITVAGDRPFGPPPPT